MLQVGRAAQRSGSPIQRGLEIEFFSPPELGLTETGKLWHGRYIGLCEEYE
ncbi:MAG: hypothetical protein KME60_15620 [Cyanomargarita calcarea GSE-NOS-MK-12-04C]|jgi:hypothetical protein|uniref:Uncharacterized protein n=1 Tax=Cyanomargarita calcarea GSE-NOS-MK-12-04C TaxID=2839659 RepID=A0A951QNN4_9CYAN|nr:hypothetical protein [Cyanomargarita calcarea GSE-NOS-MK-12-04C]